MQENTTVQKSIPSQTNNKINSKSIIIILAILALIALSAITAFTAYTYGKNQGEQESEISSDNAQQTDNDHTSETQTTTTTTTIAESTDPYKGWNTYTDQDDRISFRYPADWTLSESEYNPLGYNLSVTGESGYSITFTSSEGNYGEYCIFSDTDTSNMPENYINGLIDKKEYSSYEEFSNNGNQYRRSSTGNMEHEYIICIYDNESSFYTSYIPSVGIVKYIIPYNGNTDELNILDLILFSAE